MTAALDKLSQVKANLELLLQLDKLTVLDEQRAKLLLLIEKRGSILIASKLLGIPYSSAWEHVLKMERALGFKVVEARKGGKSGGGAKLTAEGRALLEKYLSEYRRAFGKELSVEAGYEVVEASMLVYAGSNDAALEHLLGIVRELGVIVEAHWIGSVKGLAALLLGEADVVGLHLFDQEVGEYNTPFVERYMLSERAVLVRGYQREQGFITRAEMSCEDVLNGLLESRLRFVNRNFGSGTRLLIDYTIRKAAEDRGIELSEARKRVVGYDVEVSTHLEVARAVARGEADVGIGIRWAAEAYGLRFAPITWEQFDFVIQRDKLGAQAVKEFVKLLRSEDFRRTLEKLPGYRFGEGLGEVKRLA